MGSNMYFKLLRGSEYGGFLLHYLLDVLICILIFFIAQS